MNFDFLKNIPEMNDLHTLCSESEKLALSYPNASIISARKSMEYIVKLVYGSVLQCDITGLTVFDMLRDYDFIDYLNNKNLVDSIHYIRKTGNLCVHESSLDAETAIQVLEKLHYVAGNISIILGLIDSFNEFDSGLLSTISEDTSSATNTIPDVSTHLIGLFANRLSPIRHNSSHTKVIDVHKSTKEMNKAISSGKAVCGTDTGNNTRTSFQLVAEWLESHKEVEEIAVDYIRCIISAKINGKILNIAVKSGCPALAFKNPDDSWNILGGIDYVVYATDIKADRSVLEQLRVFEANEFYTMWENLGLIRKKVSRGASDRLSAIHGKDFKTDINLHADSMSVQSFKNSNKKNNALQGVIINFPLLAENGFEKFLQKAN